MKRLVQEDVKQDIVMRAIAKGVGIYSPHTACDNCVDGGLFIYCYYYYYYANMVSFLGI